MGKKSRQTLLYWAHAPHIFSLFCLAGGLCFGLCLYSPCSSWLPACRRWLSGNNRPHRLRKLPAPSALPALAPALGPSMGCGSFTWATIWRGRSRALMTSWERLSADQPWGDAGHPKYTGFVWYRRQIALDPTDTEADGAGLLPPLNSVAEVYWNGVKVGGIGTVPPHMHSGIGTRSPQLSLSHPRPAQALQRWLSASGSARRLQRWAGRWRFSGSTPDWVRSADRADARAVGRTCLPPRAHSVKPRCCWSSSVSIPVLILWSPVAFAMGAVLCRRVLPDVRGVPLVHATAIDKLVGRPRGVRVGGITQTSVLIFLVLLLADLPQRRFAWRAVLVASWHRRFSASPAGLGRK